MQSGEYISNTIKKIRNVLTMHRNAEIRAILDIINNEYEIRILNNPENYIRIADRNDEETFVTIYGYGEESGKKYWIDFNDYPKEKKIFELFKKDADYMNAIESIMNDLDMNTVKSSFPNLKKFMGLVETDRRNDKEERHEEWRSIYNRCIEILGDKARG